MKQHKPQPQIAVVIETATITTSRGKALLYKCWCEETMSIVNIWNDSSKPNPFLKGKAVGDEIRVIAEERTDVDLNGKKVAVTYFTPIPSQK